jgi:hypothetical protein
MVYSGLMGLRWSEPDGVTRLTGARVDQAALFGVLPRIHDLGVRILSLQTGHGMNEALE